MKYVVIPRQQLGKQGEELAADYLEQAGFSIEGRNKRFGRAEIDLLARKEGLLLFVEVKVRTNCDFGFPETFVSEAQQERYHMAATTYMETINWCTSVRFDIIALHKEQGQLVLSHFEDAF